jgi:hypothetical protein
MLLEKRPETLEAIKFEGGPEGAQEVIEWVRARDPHTVVSWTPEVLNDGELVIEEALYFIVTQRSRYNSGATRSDRQFRVKVGQWFVLDKAGVACWPTDGFDLFRAYKEVPDEGARPD